MRCHFMGVALVGAAAALAVATGAALAEEGMTYAALQIAYGREQNSRADYLAFADEADLEGQVAAACVFRAVAMAESVHAAREAVAIEQMGGEPAWHREATDVGETSENLSRAIESEHREYSVVYPQFASYAREECLYDALAAINYACSAERTHEQAFARALAELNKAREALHPLIASLGVADYGDPDSPGITVEQTCYVCSGDGSIWTHPMKRCPNCGAGGAGFTRFGCACSH